ncbi:MAG: hypothetical protein LBJ70_02725 [Holosporales bacterium]|nr:hypothetical protein [Holosporales bacterium]
MFHHFRLSLALLGGSIGLLWASLRYGHDYQQEAQRVISTFQERRLRTCRLRRLAALLGPDSPFQEHAGRFVALSRAEWEQQLQALAVQAQVPRVVMHPIPHRPEAAVLEILGAPEASILSFLQGMEERCPGSPLIEKVHITHSGKALDMKVRFSREEPHVPMRAKEASFPAQAPPSFRLFSSTGAGTAPPMLSAEGYMQGPQGPRIALSGQWVKEGARVESWRVCSISPRGVLLKDDKGRTRFLRMGESLPVEEDSVPEGAR